MKITRTITVEDKEPVADKNKVEIELTYEELRQAHEEYTRLSRIEDINNKCESEGITLSEPEIESALYYYERGLEDDDTWVYALEGAIDTVIRERDRWI